MRAKWLAIGACGLFASAAMAQIALDPNSAWSVAWHKRLNSDWPFLARYQAENDAVTPTPGHPRIVFMGDSITEGWVTLSGAFFTPGRIGRGIGGQTTPQMLARFRQDVIALKPAVVHIMAGTNDIAGNTGPTTPEQTQGNIRSMVELAHANGIRVILASIPPADQFPWKPGLTVAGKIAAMNAWLKGYAARSGCVYADYWSAMKAPDGMGMRQGYSSDHVHPTAQGYRAIEPVADAAITAALRLPVPPKLAVE
jgi:lysophospholipase L1-like esterase